MSAKRPVRVVVALLLLLSAANGLSSSAAASVSPDADGSLELNENNWTRVLTDEWMIMFYAPWCPACKSLKPEWKEFAKWTKTHSSVSAASADITTHPGLTGRFVVTSLPTIIHVKDGIFRYYKMGRNKDSFISFINDQKWMQAESIPSWKSPDSIQMTLVAQFFKLSQKVRVLHSFLMAEYGFPTWGSYLIFAIVTIVIGAVLGLILVCVIDFVYPHSSHKMSTNNGKNAKHYSGLESDDELVTDELIDDRTVDNVESVPVVKSRRKIRKTD